MASRPPRELRIIAGQWRGRRWRFPPADIRPTPDRVRETLFNWLQRPIAGARCLDLFAGSGALGLEALSRGAAQVVFVDHSRAVTAALQAVLQQWQGRGALIHCEEARHFLAAAPAPFDVVFLDPPYAGGELAAAAAALQRGWVRTGGLIYVEHARREPLPALPPAWRALRTGAAGEVGYHLFEHSEAAEGAGKADDEDERGLSRDV